jgi:putative transposase
MIDRAHDLPITKQAAALTISRGSVYYLPRPVSAAARAHAAASDELQYRVRDLAFCHDLSVAFHN